MHCFMLLVHPRQKAEATASETRGFVLNWGWRYDLLVWFFVHIRFGSNVRALLRMTVDLAQLQRGETILDVGCGTGTLALESYTRVGATGRVTGIDPAPQQIAQARRKAARRCLPLDFQIRLIEQL